MRLNQTLILAAAMAILMGSLGAGSVDAKGKADKGKKDFGINTGALPDSCIKFEDSEIGQEGVSRTVDGVTITLFDWVEKDGESGEYIGFSFTVEGGEDGAEVTYSIKAGLDIFEDTSNPWINPKGTRGRKVKAISNIVFCAGEGDPPINTSGSFSM